MITCLLVSAFFGAVVVWTGPACDEQRTRQRRIRDFPKARAKLLSSGVRLDFESPAKSN